MQVDSRATLRLRAPRSRPAMPRRGPILTCHYNGPATGLRAADPHTRCQAFWRGVQAHHMDRNGWSDIAYNFGICPHGVVMLGRGEGVRSAANGTADGNDRSHAVMLTVGGNETLTRQMTDVLHQLGRSIRCTSLRFHGEWKPTACAGPAVNQHVRSNRTIIQEAPAMKWPTWAKEARDVYGTDSTDPNRRWADLSVAERLTFQTRFDRRIVKLVAGAAGGGATAGAIAAEIIRQLAG